MEKNFYQDVLSLSAHPGPPQGGEGGEGADKEGMVYYSKNLDAKLAESAPSPPGGGPGWGLKATEHNLNSSLNLKAEQRRMAGGNGSDVIQDPIQNRRLTANPNTYNLTKIRSRQMRSAPTPQEYLLWENLRDQNLGVKFRRQHIIGYFIADFACLAAKVVIEVDGAPHFTVEGKEIGKLRDVELQHLGFRVLHLTNTEIENDMKGSLLKIKRALAEPPRLSPHPGPPPGGEGADPFDTVLSSLREEPTTSLSAPSPPGGGPGWGLMGALLALLNILSLPALAQDPSYSLFHYTPYLTNPGMISIRPEARVDLNFRNQWQGLGTPFTTFNLGGYYPILSKDKFNQFGAAGGMILRDINPSSQIKSTQVVVAGSYKLPVNYANFFHCGIQLGYASRQLDVSQYTTGSQWNGVKYDPTLGVQEDRLGQSRGAATVGLGTQWTNYDVDNDIRGEAGLAVYNINGPNISFQDLKIDNLQRRYVINGGLRAVKTNEFTVFPDFRVQVQGKATMYTLGSLARMRVFDSRYQQQEGFFKKGTFGVGLWYQYAQAIIGSVELVQPNYIVSLGYDFGLSDLKNGNKHANATEVFVCYKQVIGRKKKPDIRYFRTRGQGGAPLPDGSQPTPANGKPATQTTPQPGAPGASPGTPQKPK